MQSEVNDSYNPESYWTTVGKHIAERESGNVVAGDDEPFYRYRRSKFIGQFLTRLDIQNRDVLEVGCGPGGNLSILVNMGPKRLAGCDLSQVMVELAQKNTGGNCDLSKSTPDALPFGNGSFDLVFTATVLQHNPDDGARGLMSEMARVSRKRVVLFEETSPMRREIHAHFSRPPSFYVDWMEQQGYRLIDQQYVHDFASRVLTGIVRRVLGGKSHEGHKKKPVSTTVEQVLIRLLAPVDNSLPVKIGLTEMAFER